MRRSDPALAAISLGIAVALLLLVHGEKRMSVSYGVPVIVTVPAALEPAGPLPSEATVSVSGPWAHLRGLKSDALGPLRAELSRSTPGMATWYVKPDSLRLPRGVRVDAVHPSQGSVELRRP